MSRSLFSLVPDTRDLAGEFLRVCNSKGLPVLVYCTRRTMAAQFKLWKVGRIIDPRDDPENPKNWIREPGAKIVTMAPPGDSFHNYGEAFDACPWELYIQQGRPSISKKLDWSPFNSRADARAWGRSLKVIPGGDLDLLDPRWRIMAEAAVSVGLEWSGTWTRFREFVHFQRAGITLAELKAA